MHLFSCLTGKLNKLTGKLYISPGWLTTARLLVVAAAGGARREELRSWGCMVVAVAVVAGGDGGGGGRTAVVATSSYTRSCSYMYISWLVVCSSRVATVL